MKIVCPSCLKKARIESRDKLNDSDTIATLYCSCVDIKSCGARFTYTLSFNHIISPPIQNYREMAFALVAGMSKEEKQALQRDLFA